MKKSTSQRLILLALAVFIFPSVAMAAWWNPLSWGVWNVLFGSKPAETPVVQVQTSPVVPNIPTNSNQSAPTDNGSGTSTQILVKQNANQLVTRQPQQQQTGSGVITVPAHHLPLPGCAAGTTLGAATCIGIDPYTSEVIQGMVGNSAPATVWLTYRLFGGSSWIQTHPYTIPGGTSGSFFELITGLTSNTKYEFIAYAQQNGVIAHGATLEFTTASR